MKCSELAKELGITPMHVGRLRKQIAPDYSLADLNDSIVCKIRRIIADVEESAEEEVAPVLESSRVRALVMHRGHGRFMLCGLYHNAERVVAMMPTGFSLDDVVGQNVWLEEIEYNDEKFYRHTSLSHQEFDPAGYKR
jgi:hypothetical protein